MIEADSRMRWLRPRLTWRKLRLPLCSLFLMISFVTASTACTRTRTVEVKVPVEVAQPPPPRPVCLQSPPPMRPRDLLGSCEDGSDDAACLSRQQLEALAEFLDAVDDWTRVVWTLCGPGSE